jgi:thymidylate synthase
MNNIDKQYQELLQDILDNGIEKQDRTGTGTISVFGRQIRHKMSDGFPLLTTKKMAWKTMVTELLWFLRGDTNIKYLVDNNCHIWDGDCYKSYATSHIKEVRKQQRSMREKGWETITLDPNYLSQEEFINKIKTDDEFANKWGELGPIYGKQWRDWSANPNHTWGIDQIQNLINDLKTNPDSRRLMVNAWNVGELDQMVLPPCHYGFQVYTRELTWEERFDIHKKYITEDKLDLLFEFATNENLDSLGVPKRAISLMWNQRSVDTFLGLPFNIASYGLLLEIIAKSVNMVPDELIGNLGDVHLYSNHIEQAKEQIGREVTQEEIQEHLQQSGINTMSYKDTMEYISKLLKREPFELPKLKHLRNDDKYKLLGEFPSLWNELKISDFELENYQSHPPIKAPLSN